MPDAEAQKQHSEEQFLSNIPTPGIKNKSLAVASAGDSSCNTSGNCDAEKFSSSYQLNFVQYLNTQDPPVSTDYQKINESSNNVIRV